MNHLTEQEVNEFKPSYYNPMKVERIEPSSYNDRKDTIEIITPPIRKEILAKDMDGDLRFLYSDILKDYRSLKQPEKKKLYAYRRGLIVSNVRIVDAFSTDEVRYFADIDTSFISTLEKGEKEWRRAPEYDIEFEQ